jgi:hypothetical protein
MFSIEWEMPYFNMGRTFNYAELAYLITMASKMITNQSPAAYWT